MSTSFEQWVRSGFGSNLGKARFGRKLFKEDLSEKTSIPISEIRAIEAGRQDVTLVQMFQIAEALECEPSELLPSKPPELAPCSSCDGAGAKPAMARIADKDNK